MIITIALLIDFRGAFFYDQKSNSHSLLLLLIYYQQVTEVNVNYSPSLVADNSANVKQVALYQ